MCIAIPARVLSVDGLTAEFERYGERLTVSLAMLSQPVAAGDYVVVQTRQYAVERMGAADARETLNLFDQIIEAMQPGGGPAERFDAA